jgi:hypothetical protein
VKLQALNHSSRLARPCLALILRDAISSHTCLIVRHHCTEPLCFMRLRRATLAFSPR